jgi:hypothetical protein
VSYIDELKDAIRPLHGVESRHVESVPMKETLQGEKAWEGIAEVFELIDHPKAPKAFAWTHKTRTTDPNSTSSIHHGRAESDEDAGKGQQPEPI